MLYHEQKKNRGVCFQIKREKAPKEMWWDGETGKKGI